MAQKFTVPITVKQLASAGSDAVTVYVDQDTFSRLKVEAGGRLTWGSGASAGDVNLYRASADVLQTDDTFKTPALFVDNIEIDTTGATTTQALVFNGVKFVPGDVAASGGASLTVSDTAPASPEVGDLWFNSTNARTYVYYDSSWVEVGGSGGVASLDDIGNVTAPSPSNGDYLQWNGSAWTSASVASISSINDIADVVVTSAQNGQLLEFDGTNWVNAVRPSSEPIGHENKADSVISFNEGTRTFSIAPASTSYTVWCAGKRFVKTTTSTVTIPDTSGLYYIYFNSSGVLAYRTDFFVWDTDTPTAYVYWNEVDNKAYFFADERHGITLDWATHEYLHRTRGAVIANGFGVSSYSIDGNGSSDDHAKFDLAGGTFFDEDLQVDIVHSNTPTANTWEQVLEGDAEIPVFYRLNNHWTKDAATEFSFKQGTSRPKYNLNTAGTWSTIDIDNNKFAISWIIATNNLTQPVLAVMGQASYNTIGEAEAASWEGLSLDGFPVVEFRPLHKVVFQGTDSFTNSVNAAIRGIYDLRRVSSNGTSIPSTPVSDHGSMTGLSDDDHTQYLTDARHNALDHSTAMGTVVLDDINDVTAPTPSSGDFLKWNGTAWVNDPINLGTDTVGNYVSSVTAGTGISVTFTPSEGAGASVSLNATLDNLSDVTAPSPVDQSTLVWDAYTSQWVANSQNITLGVPGTTDYLTIGAASGITMTSATEGNIGLSPNGFNATSSNGSYFNLNVNNVTFSNGTDSFMIDPYWGTSGQVLAFTPGFGSGGTWGPTTPTLDFLSDVSAASPSAGNVLTYNGSAWTAASAASGGSTVTASTTPPASPTSGSIWFDSSTAKTYVYYDSFWVEIGGTSGGAKMYVSLTAPSSPLEGQLWFKSDTAQTFAYYDSFWVEVGAAGMAAIAADSAPASPVTGQLWFNSSTGGTYVYYDLAWIEVGAVAANTVFNLVDAKGDLLVGTADNTLSNLTAGSANQVLTVDSSTATGLKWATPTTYASTGKAIAMAIVFGG